MGDGEDLQNADIYPIPVHELAEIDGEDGENTAEAQESEEEDDGEQEAYFDGEAE